MKASKLSTTDRDVLAADSVPLSRERVLRDAIDAMYFKIQLGAGRVIYQGAVTEVLNGDAYVMRFPDAATTVAGTMMPTRPLWVRTRPRFDVWYSSNAGSTNPFSFRGIVRAYGPGGTTTGALVTSNDWTAPGPASAGGVLLTSSTSSGVFPASPYGVTEVELRRLGAAAGDTNAGNLDVLLAVVTFQEMP